MADSPESIKSDRKSPGFWFYPADYERDVQILTLSAQGLWSRMLCWMHENEAHRGFLELPNGAPMSTREIAAKIGKTGKQISRCLDEMEHVSIFNRDSRNCIYCRRMARETEISEIRRNAAHSRLTRAKRAEDGTFVGSFAGANDPAKDEQKPTVTASVSDSVIEQLQIHGAGGALALTSPTPKPPKKSAKPREPVSAKWIAWKRAAWIQLLREDPMRSHANGASKQFETRVLTEAHAAWLTEVHTRQLEAEGPEFWQGFSKWLNGALDCMEAGLTVEEALAGKTAANDPCSIPPYDAEAYR